MGRKQERWGQELMAELWGSCGQRGSGISGYLCPGSQPGGGGVGSWLSAGGRFRLEVGEVWPGMLPPPGFPKADPGVKLVGYFLISVSGPQKQE